MYDQVKRNALVRQIPISGPQRDGQQQRHMMPSQVLGGAHSINSGEYPRGSPSTITDPGGRQAFQSQQTFQSLQHPQAQGRVNERNMGNGGNPRAFNPAQIHARRQGKFCCERKR